MSFRIILPKRILIQKISHFFIVLYLEECLRLIVLSPCPCKTRIDSFFCLCHVLELFTYCDLPTMSAVDCSNSRHRPLDRPTDWLADQLTNLLIDWLTDFPYRFYSWQYEELECGASLPQWQLMWSHLWIPNPLWEYRICDCIVCRPNWWSL